MQFDLKNGNTLWREATDLEMSQLAAYDTFRDLGRYFSGEHVLQCHIPTRATNRYLPFRAQWFVLWATDIGNAYLEAFTMEQNYIVAGPEFGQLEGHYLIIVKALYGLRTSGLRRHERFADCLCNEGFSPCKAEPDILMRLNGNLYEYVATYVDDLCLGMLDPKSFTGTLQKKYNLS
jgi:hypothetical protein